MATLEKLNERKRELEERLAEGDLSVEAALDQVDNAIAARTREIEYSQRRIAAVRNAVEKGVPLADTKPAKVAAAAKKRAKVKTKKPLNRF